MAPKSLREFFVEELKDMYDGEKQLTRALPRMVEAAQSEELRAALTRHLEETEGQVKRLEQVFRHIGEPPSGKKCTGIQGILDESKPALEELHGALLDAALIAGSQKVEHYEIASYGTLAYFADLLDEQEAKKLLGDSLDEERAADETLNVIAKSSVNREALAETGDEDDEEDEDASKKAGDPIAVGRSASPRNGRSNGGRAKRR